jgi:hypothetical protein
MNKDEKASISKLSLTDQLNHGLQLFGRYRVVLFVVFVGCLYAFVAYQAYSLSNQATNSTSDVESQVTSLTPRIDTNVVDQLESLKDNSVNVKALFEDARQNPFAE